MKFDDVALYDTILYNAHRHKSISNSGSEKLGSGEYRFRFHDT